MANLTTNITPDNNLLKIFSEARNGMYRALKIIIDNEALICPSAVKPTQEWNKEYDSIVTPFLESDQPCYIFYRFDIKNNSGQYLWLFITYVPDISPVRYKTLYSATQNEVRKSFGGSTAIKDEMYCTEMKDASLDGYQAHLVSLEAPNPLREDEEILVQMQLTQAQNETGSQERTSHIGGLSFPIDKSIDSLLQKLIDNTINCVELSIDVGNEKINCENSYSLRPESIQSKIPSDSPRYYIYRFKHSYEGAFESPFLFVYFSPGYKSSIKERMLYASSIASVISKLDERGVEITKRLEISSIEEFSEKNFISELHPPKTAPQQNFAKPPPPAARKSQSARPKGSSDGLTEMDSFYS